MDLPDFLGIGAARCGTSWLDSVLRSHSELYMSERRKEIHFFDLYYDRGLSWYQDFFQDSLAREQAQKPTPEPQSNHASSSHHQKLGQKLGEITPEYLYYPEVPNRIHQHLPNCKFLVMLRNPADRAYSHYGFLIRELNESRRFETLIDEAPEVFDRGLYYQQLQRYLELFPPENFLVLIFEEVMSNPNQALNQLSDFLGIAASQFNPDVVSRKVNSSKQSRFPRIRLLARNLRDELRNRDLDWLWNLAKRSGLERAFESAKPLPKMDPDYRKTLLSRYAEDIAQLESLLGKDLSVWS
ncbi:MAG: sulfotransferase domain-containing protein [Cyanobacteria bacterium J06621_11]